MRADDTVGPEDAFRKIMACHGSPVGQERACNGYLAREGWRNLNVRLHVALGNMESPDAVLEECEVYGIELHRDYPEVLERYYSMTMGDYDRQRIELERLYGSELAAKVLENELCRQKEQNRKKRRRP